MGKPDNMMLMAIVMMTPGFYIIMHFGLICYDPEEDYYYISIVAPVLSVHYQAARCEESDRFWSLPSFASFISPSVASPDD